MNTIMLLHEDALFARIVSALCECRLWVHQSACPRQLLDWLATQEQAPSLALLDLDCSACRKEPEQALRLVRGLLEQMPGQALLVIVAADDRDMERRLRSSGVAHVLSRPLAPEDFASATQALRCYLSTVLIKNKVLCVSQAMPIGRSFVMQELMQAIARFSNLPFPVLVTGESGCGKEWVARALHDQALRCNEPFVCVNCAAVADTLFEAALFGHARGAYTGALQARPGFFEEAGSGTLFLDEIGDMPLAMQAKLLRVLENGDYVRVGETRSRVAAARIVAATNHNLEKRLDEGLFRADLYYRLSVLAIRVAPLRERQADKLLLWQHFVEIYALQTGTQPCSLAEDAERMWMAYDFPGNVRELRNIVIRLQVLFPGTAISAAHLQPQLRTDQANAPGSQLDETVSVPGFQGLLDQPDFQLDRLLARWESEFIHAALRRTDGNISATARMLGIHRTTLYSRLDGMHLGR